MTVKWHASNGSSIFWHRVWNSISEETAKSVMRITGITTGVNKLYQTTTCVLSI
jgi:hypothetical protein